MRLARFLPALWIADPDEPQSARPTPPPPRDTLPAPPPSAGRYCLVAAERVATVPPPAPASRVRPSSAKTDPCIVPGSDRMGAGVVAERVTILPPPWAPVRPTGGER